eukprot:30897-Pelagococcus_subviridis.AAC.40
MQFTNSRADSLVYLPEAARLSCNIIHDCFGDDSERVCDSLLQQGQRTFFELVRITARFCSIVHMLILTKNSKQTTGVQKSNLLTFQGLRPRRCEHALLVLIQHNCIQPCFLSHKATQHFAPASVSSLAPAYQGFHGQNSRAPLKSIVGAWQTVTTPACRAREFQSQTARDEGTLSIRFRGAVSITYSF